MTTSNGKTLVGLAAAAALMVPMAAAAQGMPSEALPSQARPGQCFARVLVSATYRTEAQTVITQEAYERIDVTDPVFRATTQAVETSPEHKRYVTTEPVFRAENHTVVTRPAYERLVAVQPTLGTRSETIVIREPRLVWRPGHNLSGIRRLDPATGEVFCLVEEPAVTQTVTRRVATTPASVRRETVPAQTQTVQRRVLVTPASVREVLVPAASTSVNVHQLVTPATERRVMTPEARGTVNRQVLETGERYEWVAVVCDNTPSGQVSVTAAQRALAQKGYYRGPIDGIVGPLTTDAARRFQRDQGLPGNGALTVETVRKLGL